MNEVEVERLYEDLSEEYGVPVPVYIFYDRRPEVSMPMPGLTISVSRKVGMHLGFGGGIVGDDPFGLILLSRGPKGVRKDETIHEFFHYLDHLTGIPTDEASVISRTRKYMNKKIINYKINYVSKNGMSG